MPMFFTDRALKSSVLYACGPGGFLGIPPVHERSFKVNFIGSGVPNNNLLIYSLTWPPSCPNDGVHHHGLEAQ